MDVTDSVAASRQRVVGFADVVRIPLRRWRIVLAVTAVVTLAVLVYLFFLPATYTATTVVVLRPVVTDPFTLPVQRRGPGHQHDRRERRRARQRSHRHHLAAPRPGRRRRPRRAHRRGADRRPGAPVRVRRQRPRTRRSPARTPRPDLSAGPEDIYEQQRAALLLSYDSTMRQVTDQRQAAQKGLPGSAGGGAEPRRRAPRPCWTRSARSTTRSPSSPTSAPRSPRRISVPARSPRRPVPRCRPATTPALLYLLGASARRRPARHDRGARAGSAGPPDPLPRPGRRPDRGARARRGPLGRPAQRGSRRGGRAVRVARRPQVDRPAPGPAARGALRPQRRGAGRGQPPTSRSRWPSPAGRLAGRRRRRATTSCARCCSPRRRRTPPRPRAASRSPAPTCRPRPG